MNGTTRNAGAGRAWRTWSGTARCVPARIAAPRDEAGIAAAVRSAVQDGIAVRAAGTGHSFNPLACTDGMLLDLSRCRGVLALDPDAGSVTVLPGTSLVELSLTLDRCGLALSNLGTLADQTVAGAVSTGNHGTGLAHPPFAGQVTALRLVTAEGAVRTLDAERDPEVFRCARTALGALGVISAVTLRCVPRFNLRVTRRREPLEALLERFGGWAAGADHVSMSWLPWESEAATRSLIRTDEPPTQRAGAHRYAATLAEVRCGAVGHAGRLRPGVVPWLTGLGGGRAGRPEQAGAGYVDTALRAFTFPQPVRFLALEHALPLAETPAALRDLGAALRRCGRYSPYSVLVRVGAGDDAPLSPAYGRFTGYVNVTVPRAAGYAEVLRTVEHVLRGYDGRPHWAKAHTATAQTLAPRYPEWDRFARVRAELDPAGVFGNDYLDRVLGPVRTRPEPALEPVAAGGV